MTHDTTLTIRLPTDAIVMTAGALVDMATMQRNMTRAAIADNDYDAAYIHHRRAARASSLAASIYQQAAMFGPEQDQHDWLIRFEQEFMIELGSVIFNWPDLP